MQPDKLTTDVLLRLTGQALNSFLGCAEGYEARAAPGIWCVLSGEPTADLNYILVRHGGRAVASTLESYVAECDRRELPFAVLLGPEAALQLSPTCEQLKLVHATKWPLMICPAGVVKSHPAEGVEVKPMSTEDDRAGMAEVLAHAFSMPVESVRRAVPLQITELPGLEIHVARREGRVLSTVTVTRHDRTVGIWAMGTLPEAQGKGVGKALLSQVMNEHRRRNAESFFLGATAAGFPLYQRLGYETVAEAQVWVRGETSQA